MAYYKRNFMRHLDYRGIKYEDYDDYTVKVRYTCENINTVEICFFFDEDGEEYVEIIAFSIISVPKDKLLNALVACNILNSKLRWVKFVIDNDNDINIKVDAVIDSETVGEECVSLMNRILNAANESYPLIMRSIWHND